ncbi:type II toxin-antitoxin system RelE/ParE family toxin [Methylorubrum subtropicum]|uniref:type II toxin-antitoxin system RelE/ParE family toxin n=1 Tax=Methylorubrum subtropicum TaxID=3138812 RepID=UPI00399C58FD
MRDRCTRLADFPDVGRRRDDIRPNLRLVAFERRVIIVYAFDAARLRILCIFYGGRDVETLLAEGAADD